MSNVFNTHNCFGCGLCATICKHQVIDIALNRDGFYEPKIVNAKACTNCGLCAKVCSFKYENVEGMFVPLLSYGVWSKNERVREICSSGGAGFEIAKYLIQQGYKLCGVRYNAEKGRAEHFIASNIDEAIYTVGSKYIQSFTVDAFKEINRKFKYLVIGTPCQIDSFRRYIRIFKCEDNFILMDFFCHSVPSMNAWNFYVQQVQKKTGKIKFAAWRCKQTGWHDSWNIIIDGEKASESTKEQDGYAIKMKGANSAWVSRCSQGDLFYRLFLGDFCSSPACANNCRFKHDHSAADIRIGDFWGKTYENEDKGVSTVVVFSERGKEVISKLSSCTFIPHSFDVATEGQMKKNISHATVRPLMMRLLRFKHPNPFWVKSLVFVERVIKRLKRI